MCNDPEIGPRHIGQFPRTGPVRNDGGGPREQDVREAPQRVPGRAHVIKFVKYALLGLMTLDEAARALRVGNTTLDRRKREFLADGRLDTDDLRKLAAANAFKKQTDT